MFVLTWDEGGGFYDYVPPQPMPSPDGIKPSMSIDLLPGDICHGSDSNRPDLRFRVYRLSRAHDGHFSLFQEELSFPRYG